MGGKNVSMVQQEGGTNKFTTSEGRNQENPKINYFFIDHPLGILKCTWKEQQNSKSNDSPMPKFSCLERYFIKPTDHLSFLIEDPGTLERATKL
ncbi:hypothetical protein H5410_060297 [Solanum commersonii]|uniref:Uncharacterized protein n=1 Tax=Solanum commersonii TaxID=4109 RepID=A0A9J5W4P8_SOLCO|nr:hypothetical protein H5410_060297 [Solanum commersonii]